MSTSFHPLDTVRVVAMLEPAERHLVLREVQRPPRLGDIGTVVEGGKGPDDSVRYLVESVNGEGETIWFATFTEDELMLEEAFERSGGRGSP